MNRSLRRIGDGLTYLALGAYALFTLFPLYWVLLTSFKQESDTFTWPPKFFDFVPTLDNYARVLNFLPDSTLAIKANFVKYFANSLLIVGGALVLTIVLSILFAYALTRFRFRGREFFAFIMVAVKIIPLLVLLLPLYIIYREWGLYNTYPGMILVYLYIGIPFFVWFIRGHIASVPSALDEAARMDGCSTLQILWHVIVPVILPGIVSSALLVIIYMWNNFLFVLILGGQGWETVTVGIYNYVGYFQTSYGGLAASSVIAMAPVIIIGVAIQKYIVSGLTTGAVKG